MMNKRNAYKKNYLGGEILVFARNIYDKYFLSSECVLDLWHLSFLTNKHAEINFITRVNIYEKKIKSIKQEINRLIENEFLLDTINSIKEKIAQREIEMKLLDKEADEILEEVSTIEELYSKEYMDGEFIASIKKRKDTVWLDFWYQLEEKPSIKLLLFSQFVPTEINSISFTNKQMNDFIDSVYLEKIGIVD